MSQRFYFEAIMIDYAMIEDRLRSFLYHIGALKDRNSYKLDFKATKLFLLELYNGYNKKKLSGLNLNNISNKYNLILAVQNWVCYSEGAENRYQLKLKFACEGLDPETVTECLNKLEQWCRYRNEIIHGLMNKNIISLQKELADKATEGMKLARQIDGFVVTVKKGHVVRKSVNLKTE